jgi:hypothetical protein
MAILSNLRACPVECEAYSSGVMRSPAMAGLILEILQHIHQGIYFVAPAVNPAFGGTHALTLNKISHFWMDTNKTSQTPSRQFRVNLATHSCLFPFFTWQIFPPFYNSAFVP